MSIPRPPIGNATSFDLPLFAPLAHAMPPSAGGGVPPQTPDNEKRVAGLQIGLAGAERAAVADEDFTARAYGVAVALIEKKRLIVADDIWRELDGLKVYTDHPNAMGAVLANLGRSGKAWNTRIGIPSSKLIKHGRPQTLWAKRDVTSQEIRAYMTERGIR